MEGGSIMKKFNYNRGSASLEASLAVPVFLIAMVYLYLVFQSVLAEMIVYEAAAETAEYMAEYSFLDTCTLLVPQVKFPGYVDDEKQLVQFVKNGASGVSFLGSTMLDENDMVVLRVRFQTRYAGEQEFVIKKRAYTGAKTVETDTQSDGDEEAYVYVTDYESVYHTTRTCSYLMLTIHEASLSYAEKQGYHPCGFCGENCSEGVYITEEGRSYHSDIHCSGLKRTVYRKKISEVDGLHPCTRCGRE